jgi:peptidoglycan/xylan/chitin deacetylase (PgdA/CDA1 family)
LFQQRQRSMQYQIQRLFHKILSLTLTAAALVAMVGGRGFTTRIAIINFDDGYKSQFTNAKPLLDKYGFKASFFIVCNFVGKSAKQMNSTSIVNFSGKGVEQMNWTDVLALHKQGEMI